MSHVMDTFSVVTCRFMMSEWMLTSHVLQTHTAKESHNATTVASVLDTVSRRWGIEDKVVTCTTDKDRNLVDGDSSECLLAP